MGRNRNPKPHRQTVTRYETPDGKRCKSTDPGAIKRTTTSESYYVSLPDPETGKPVNVPLGTSDLTQAHINMRNVLRERREAEMGLLSDGDRQLVRPIAEHVEDWLAAVAAGGVTAKRVEMMRYRVARLIERAGWKRVGEIRRSTCQVALAALQAEPGGGKGEKTMSAQTRNHYLSHARQFCRWLRSEKRLEDDPLEGLEGVSVESDRRHDRRSPEEEEVAVLFDYLAGAFPGHAPPVRSKMTAERRALGYMVAMCTGLRSDEVRSLTRESIDLDAGLVRLRAARAKNRKRAAQPLPAWLRDRLRAWLDAGGELWDAFPSGKAGVILRGDLERARAGWIDAAPAGPERETRQRSAVCLYEVQTEDGPLFWDFHALRHWYVSQLAAQGGISPSTIQALARHSDPKLTMGIYAKARASGVREAVDQIRVPGGGSGTDAGEADRPTETDAE